MMGEEGFYQSEEEQFFQRVHLLWRATRILLDVGLHTRGMTFEQAAEHMTTHLRVDRANAEAEVRRDFAEAAPPPCYAGGRGSEEDTPEIHAPFNIECPLLLEKKNNI